MTRKTLQERIDGLLAVFKEAGLELTEEQQAAVSRTVDNLLDQIVESEQTAVAATRKVTQRRLDREYKRVVESILAKQEEHNRLVGVVAMKDILESETKRIRHELASKMDAFLSDKVERLVTERTAVDYGKLKKYEAIVESLKGLVVEGDEAVKAAAKRAESRFAEENTELIRENQALTEKLEKAKATNTDIQRQLETEKAAMLLERKLRDLPEFEAGEMRKRLTGASIDQIQKQFRRTLSLVQEELNDKAREEAGKDSAGDNDGEETAEKKDLGSQIADVLQKADESSEVDKVKPYDGPERPVASSAPAEPVKLEGDPDDLGEDYDYDVVQLPESVRKILEGDAEAPAASDGMSEGRKAEDQVEPPDDDTPLEESERIDSRVMQYLISRYDSITPRGGNC